MGRELKYKPGSFYRVSDHSGFPVRAENTRKMWNGLIVEESTFEPRQPQDSVRGVRDDQSVRDARPLAPNTFTGPVWTTTSANVGIGATIIPVESVASFSVGQTASIMLDSGILFHAEITGINLGPSLSIAAPMPYTAAAANQVWNAI